MCDWVWWCVFLCILIVMLICCRYVCFVMRVVCVVLGVVCMKWIGRLSCVCVSFYRLVWIIVLIFG